MKENLRIILLIVGVLAIIALFLHGVWSSRKEKSSLFGKKKRTSNHRVDNEAPRISDDIDELEHEAKIAAFDNDVSEVRVVGKNHAAENATDKAIDQSYLKRDDSEPSFDIDNSKIVDDKKEPSFKTETATKFTEETKESNDASALETQSDSASNSSDNHQGLSTENSDKTQNKGNQENPENSNAQETPVAEHIIVLHVMGVNNNLLRGDLLLNSFLNAGLNHGDMNIFHRHLSTAASPVIFSVANMLTPGTFEPNQMQDFTTIGVTFFMVLPSVGQPIQNFKLMLQTIQRVAEDVGGQVYDDKRTILTQLKIEAHIQAIEEWMDKTGQNA